FSSMDSIFGGVEITERNFNIMGIAHLFPRGPIALRGGGEFLHAKANIGDRQTTYTIQWTKPYFLDTPWLFGVQLENANNRALSKAYELRTYGGSVHATYIMNDFFKYDLHYRAKHTGISIRDRENFFLEEEADHTGFISGAGLSL